MREIFAKLNISQYKLNAKDDLNAKKNNFYSCFLLTYIFNF